MRKTRPTPPLHAAARAVVAVSLVAGLTSFLPLTGARAAAPKPLFEQIGTLDRFPADARAALGSAFVPVYDTDPKINKANSDQKGRSGTIIMIPEVRQLWQIYFIQGGGDFAAVIRDLDSLKIIRTVPLPGGLDRSTVSAHGGEWAHAIDSKGLRLFLTTLTNREVLEIDLRTFTIKTRQIFTSVAPANVTGLVPFVPGGLTYDPYDDALLVLYGGPPATSVGNTNTFLYTLDVSTAPAPADPMLLHQLQSCGGPLTSTDIGGWTYGWSILPTRDYLYVPCHRAGNAGIVIRMTRPGPNNRRPQEDVAVGPVTVETVLADPASERLFLITLIREIWVFEAKTMSFLGIAATGPDRTNSPTGYGLDPQTGRVFFQSSTFGIGVIEGRFFPIPQARTTPRKTMGQERIFSDHQTNRVFVLEGLDQNKPPAYRIYRTEAAPLPPPQPDPDRNTVDMPEREGITEARYFSNGSGYGARVILAKGFSTVAPAPALAAIAPTALVIERHINSKCGYTDRELVAGWVRKAEYDTGSTAASAIAFDVDGTTKQDLDKPSRCDVAIRDQNGTEQFRGIFATAPTLDELTQAPRDNPDTPQDESNPRWDWDQAECTSSDEAGKATDSAAVDDFGPSMVDCPEPGGTLTASAATGLDGGVSVRQASTATTIKRTAAGVESTVTAVAQGVDIAGVISFAEIRSTATSASNGRPKQGPMSTHDVVVRGAMLNGTTICDTCQDLPALVNTLNQAAGGRAVFRTAKGANSGLDEDLKRGSKRGAQTAVKKSTVRQTSDRILVGDFTTEVPGLEMTVFNDNVEWGRARQLYQFAGVSSAATYNIALRPTGVPFDDDSGVPFDDDISIADIGDTPFSGLVEEFDDTTDLTSATPAVNEDDQGGIIGSILPPFRALVRGIRLFFTNPRHSLLLLTAWALFTLPGVLSRRRRLLADV